MRLSRRNFLIASVGGATTVALATGGLFVIKPGINGIITDILHRHLPELELSPDFIDTFTTDFYRAEITAKNRESLFEMMNLVWRVRSLGHLLPEKYINQQVKKFEERVITRFLMSTDYFWQESEGITDIQTVKYLGYYEPYQRPCNNVLAILGQTK